jgi:hypothetical protein
MVTGEQRIGNHPYQQTGHLDDATRTRLIVAAARYTTQGGTGRLAATLFTEARGSSVLRRSPVLSSRKLSSNYAGGDHGRTILNLASRSTSMPFDSPKAAISSGILFVIMPPKLNILEPVLMGPSLRVKRTASARKGMPR